MHELGPSVVVYRRGEVRRERASVESIRRWVEGLYTLQCRNFPREGRFSQEVRRSTTPRRRQSREREMEMGQTGESTPTNVVGRTNERTFPLYPSYPIPISVVIRERILPLFSRGFVH